MSGSSGNYVGPVGSGYNGGIGANSGFGGSGLTNYDGQRMTTQGTTPTSNAAGNPYGATQQPYYTGNQTQQWDPRQVVGWGDQRLSVGGPAPGPNMAMAARNAPNAPPWLQEQMAGYYAAPFMTANGTSDFPRWGQSPMSYNPQYNPQGQQPQTPQQPQQPPANPYAPPTQQPYTPPPQQRTATPQQIASGNIYGFTPEQLARTPAGLFGPDPRLG